MGTTMRAPCVLPPLGSRTPAATTYEREHYAAGVDAPPGYLVAGPTAGRREVELWSTRRLPFEPKGEALAMRQDLRAALRRLDAARGEVLHAVYASAEDGFADVENVLLYNVGASALARAGRAGVRFERSRAVPAPVGTSLAARHHHRYALRPPSAGSDCWRRGATLAAWHHLPIGRLSLDPATIVDESRSSAESGGSAAAPVG